MKVKAAFVKVDARPSGCLQSYVTLSYKDLKAVFGAPNGHSDSYKTSTMWVIQDTKTGETFTVYDYKETSLYGGKNYPSVRSFRARSSHQWHIGGGDRAKALIPKLQAFIRKALAAR